MTTELGSIASSNSCCPGTAYAELLTGQAAMHACHEWFGVPVMTFDDSRRKLNLTDPIRLPATTRWRNLDSGLGVKSSS